MSRKQTPESFWAKVRVGSDAECWEWSGACNNTGYGIVGWHSGHYTAHRIAAWLSGLVVEPNAPKSSKAPTHVLHRCDNRKCCNPHHFFLGTFTDNMRDAYAKNRKAQPKGERHANAKLTNLQAEAIRKRYREGELQIPLAKEYGVSQRAISLIVRGETYK